MTDVRILTRELGGTPLSLLLQRGGAPSDWLPSVPAGGDGWLSRARARASERDWTAAWSRLAPALAASGHAATRLERVQREGGVVVTTGQQPGLFGGPIYTWTKALGALALADEIEAATGVPTAPIFWAATDDADFAEASSTVLARVGGAERLHHAQAPAAGTPLMFAPLGDMSALLAALAAACGSAADSQPLECVRLAYGQPGQTVGGAYVALLRALLAPLGIAVLDASHAAVAEASAETNRAALAIAPTIERALAARADELRAAGYAPQVDDMPGMSLVFGRDGAIKRRLRTDEQTGAGAVLTPNVLLRPIVEHEILPTVAYCAGPGELAYFAQVSAVAAAMGTAAPLAVPRWSCMLLEPHVDAVLQRLGLQHEELSTPHAAERTIARASMSAQTTSGIAELRAAIAALPESLGDEPHALNLDTVVEGAMGSLRHRADRLERRLLAGIARREHDRMRDLATARAALYPFGAAQERTLNLIPILARHGVELLGELHVAARAHASAIVGSTTETPADETYSAPIA